MNLRQLVLVLSGFLLATPVFADPPAEVDVRNESAALDQLAEALPSRLTLKRIDLEGLGGADLDLRQVPVFAKGSRVVVNDGRGEREMHRPNVRFLRGRIRGLPGSVAAVSVSDKGQISGLLTDGFTTWRLQRSRVDSRLETEEVHDLPGQSRGPMQCGKSKLGEVRSARELGRQTTARNAAAGSDPFAGVASAAAPAALPTGMLYEATVAIETDYEFYRLFGNEADALTYIGDLFNYISAIYENEIQTRLSVGDVFLWTTSADPWDENADTECRLLEFGEYWQGPSRRDVPRTVAHFLSGASLGGGIAWLDALCADPFRASVPASCSAVGSGNNGGDFGLSANLDGVYQTANGIAWDASVVAHEIGHNFGSDHSHCYGGVDGNPDPVDACYNGESGAGCWGGAEALPSENSLTGGTAGGRNGTIMSYCHLLSGGEGNIAGTFGRAHPYGKAPDRVPNLMASTVAAVATSDPICIPVTSTGDERVLSVAVSGSGSVTSDPAGIDCPGTCSVGLPVDTVVTLTPTAAAGFSFKNWTGACSGSGACVVTMSQSRQVGAVFNDALAGTSLGEAVDNTTLTWQTGGAADWYAQGAVAYSGGSAAVSGEIGNESESWIQTSVTGPGILLYRWRVDSEADYDFLTFSANGTDQEGAISGSTDWALQGWEIPAGNWTFRWTYAKDFSVAEGADRGWLDTVSFIPGNQLNVTLRGTGSGTVTSSPEGIDCGTDCSGIFPDTYTVTLTATPAAGSMFEGWSGACSGTLSCVLPMTSARSVSATFGPERDVTPPVVTPVITGTAGIDGWYSSNVTVAWTATDPESRVTTQRNCRTTRVRRDTDGQTVSCTANSEGGAVTESVVIKRDTVAPTASLTSPANGATYGRGTAIAAAYSCADARAGIASCEGTVADGALIDTSDTGSKSFSVTATDAAGNTRTVTYSYAVVVPLDTGDDTAATVSGRSTTINVLDNDGGAYTIVGVTDPAHGTASISGTTIRYTADPDYVGQDSFTYTVSDGSRTGSATVTITVGERVPDTTPPIVTPVVTGTTGSGDWYVSGVRVEWRVQDTESDLTDETGCDTTWIVDDTAGITLTCRATSEGGTASDSVTIRKDASAPLINVVEPTPGATYQLDESVAWEATCTDGGITVDCDITGALGAQIDTSATGFGSFVASATDAAGNSRTVTVDYRVVTGTAGPTINTLAGGSGSTAAAGPALVAAVGAALGNPDSVAVDANGHRYVAVAALNRIFKVDSGGALSTYAGTGEAGSSGDDGLASAASLNRPGSVTVDADGNVYVADTGNNKIRRIGTEGIITTVAGSGASGFAGDGGSATAARLNRPTSVAVAANGTLYIADSGNNRVREVAPGGVIQTLAGQSRRGFSGDGGSATRARLNNPTGVAVNPAGEVYIADTGNQRVRLVGTNGVISTVAGNGRAGFSGDTGTATSAQLNSPQSVAVTSGGLLLIADTGNHRIRQVDTEGRITTIAGNGAADFAGDDGAAVGASLNRPTGVAVDLAGSVYVADYQNERVRKIDVAGEITTVAGGGTDSGGGGGSTGGSVGPIVGVGADSSGNAYIADPVGNRVYRVDSNGGVTLVAGVGTGGSRGDGGQATAAQLRSPTDVVYFDGALYIADRDNHRIRVVNGSGTIGTYAGSGRRGFGGDNSSATRARLRNPSAIAMDGAGNLYIADTGNSRIRRVSTSGVISTVAGSSRAGSSGDGGAATAAQLNGPTGIAVAADGTLYIADTGNNRIRVVSPGGIIDTLAGTGAAGNAGDGGLAVAAALNAPSGVAVQASGAILVADAGNDRVRQIDTSGYIDAFAGTGAPGNSGDGGAPEAAQLNGPADVAVAADGTIYIADPGNQSLRVIR